MDTPIVVGSSISTAAVRIPAEVARSSTGGPLMKKRRNRGGRSRLGCLTCRAKHVKCDERVPICRRCERLGLACQTRPQGSQNAISLTEPSSGPQSCRPLRPRGQGPEAEMEKGLDIRHESDSEQTHDSSMEMAPVGRSLSYFGAGLTGQGSLLDEDALLLNLEPTLEFPMSTDPSPEDDTWKGPHSCSHSVAFDFGRVLSTDHIPLPNALVLSREEHHALQHYESVFATTQTPKDAPWSFPTLLLRNVSYSSMAVHCALAVSLLDLDVRCAGASINTSASASTSTTTTTISTFSSSSSQRGALMRSHFARGSSAFHDAISFSLARPVDHVEMLATIYFHYVYLSQQRVLDRPALTRLSQTALRYIQAFFNVSCFATATQRGLTAAAAAAAAAAMAPTPALRSFLCRLLFWIYKEDVYASAHRCAGDVARYFAGRPSLVGGLWDRSRPALALGWGAQYPARQSLQDVHTAQVADMQVEVLQLQFAVTELGRFSLVSSIVVCAEKSPEVEERLLLIETKFAAIFHLASTSTATLADPAFSESLADSAAASVATYYAWKMAYHRCVGDAEDQVAAALSALLRAVRRVVTTLGLRDLQRALLMAAVESRDPIHRDWVMGKLEPWCRAALAGSLRDEAQLDAWTLRANPELCYEEHQAHDAITTLLQSQGFAVTLHAYGLQTAFVAESGAGGRLVTLCAEYDALPGLGHACGHNLIATAAVAAFLGVAAALKSSKLPGRVRLLGCPAEEGGGGKIKLLQAGAFVDVDAALMVHPTPPVTSHRLPSSLAGIAYGTSAAASRFSVAFTGKAAHAGAMPWMGVNALDAAALSYSAVSMLRQQLLPTDRVNLIISEGGTGTNVITAHSGMAVGIRTATLAENISLTERVRRCFDGAALATGCEVVFTDEMDAYAELRPNEALCADFSETMARVFGKEFYCDLKERDFGGFGTDMGNVSYECPSLHANFCIPVRQGENIHGPGFERAAGTEEAARITLETGAGMAATALRVLYDDSFASRVLSDFEQDKAKRVATF
ncbi:hypothetical protein EsH8_V_001181 [Colletotrichum jinshuiense]